jgi:hypothetical protein
VISIPAPALDFDLMLSHSQYILRASCACEARGREPPHHFRLGACAAAIRSLHRGGTTARRHPPGHTFSLNPFLSKSRPWWRLIPLQDPRSRLYSRLCAPPLRALLPILANSLRFLQCSLRQAPPPPCSSRPVYRPPPLKQLLPVTAGSAPAHCHSMLASAWNCSPITREGSLSLALSRGHPVRRRLPPYQWAIRCTQSTVRCLLFYFLRCFARFVRTPTRIVLPKQETVRIGFSSAIMMIGGPPHTHVTLTFVSKFSGSK